MLLLWCIKAGKKVLLWQRSGIKGTLQHSILRVAATYPAVLCLTQMHIWASATAAGLPPSADAGEVRQTPNRDADGWMTNSPAAPAASGRRSSARGAEPSPAGPVRGLISVSCLLPCQAGGEALLPLVAAAPPGRRARYRTSSRSPFQSAGSEVPTAPAWRTSPADHPKNQVNTRAEQVSITCGLWSPLPPEGKAVLLEWRARPECPGGAAAGMTGCCSDAAYTPRGLQRTKKSNQVKAIVATRVSLDTPHLASAGTWGQSARSSGPECCGGEETPEPERDSSAGSEKPQTTLFIHVRLWFQMCV